MNKFIAIIALLSLSTLAQAQATSTPPSRAGVMREGVRAQLQTTKQPGLRMGSTTKPIMMGTSTRPFPKMASTTKAMMGSTTRGIMMGEKRELKMTARKDIAVAQKDMLVQRLGVALDGLTKAKTAIGTYIDKRVTEGKPVGASKTLLATASTKIETARKAVAAVIAWKPDAKTASSSEISLTKPRATADAAIKAVKDARMAIDAVVKELRSQIKPAAVKSVESSDNQ